MFIIRHRPISSKFYYLFQSLKTLLIGSRVKVPFGAKKVSGIIVSLVEESSFAGNLKSIIDVDITRQCYPTSFGS